MSSTFAGVSVLDGDELCRSTRSAFVTSTNCGYHLLVIEDYWQTKEIMPTGKYLSSRPFIVGGREWCVDYYPNGYDESCADFISLDAWYADDRDYAQDPIKEEEPVKVKLSFSFINEVEKHKPLYICGTETFSLLPESLVEYYYKFMERDVLEQSVNLMDDGCLTIRCDIVVCNTEDADGSGTEVLLPEIDQHLNNLLQTKVGADVTFEVGGEMFAAHRCVLAARSKVFMAQLFGPMKEGSTASSVIRIKDMEAKVFRALLHFIYTDSFPEMEEDKVEAVEEGQEEEAAEDVQWLQDLLVAADRYDLQRLTFICEKQLSERIGVGLVASILALAEQHHCHRLKEACFKFIQVQCSSGLHTVMASDGWKHLITTYPSILNELFAMFPSNRK